MARFASKLLLEHGFGFGKADVIEGRFWFQGGSYKQYDDDRAWSMVFPDEETGYVKPEFQSGSGNGRLCRRQLDGTLPASY